MGIGSSCAFVCLLLILYRILCLHLPLHSIGLTNSSITMDTNHMFLLDVDLLYDLFSSMIFYISTGRLFSVLAVCLVLAVEGWQPQRPRL